MPKAYVNEYKYRGNRQVVLFISAPGGSWGQGGTRGQSQIVFHDSSFSVISQNPNSTCWPSKGSTTSLLVQPGECGVVRFWCGNQFDSDPWCGSSDFQRRTTHYGDSLLPTHEFQHRRLRQLICHIHSRNRVYALLPRFTFLLNAKRGLHSNEVHHFFLVGICAHGQLP